MLRIFLSRGVINAVVVGSGSAASAALSFVSMIGLSKLLPASEFGLFSVIFSTGACFAPIMIIGGQNIIIHHILNSTKQSECIYLFYKYITSIIFIASLILIVFLYKITNISEILILLPILTWSTIIGMTEILISKYQAQKNHLSVAKFVIFPQIVRVFLVVIAIFINEHTVFYFSSFLLISLFFLYFRKSGGLNFLQHMKLLSFAEKRNLATSGLPYALAGFMFLGYYRLSIVILSTLTNNTVAANYSIILIIISAALLLPSTIMQRYGLTSWHEHQNHISFKKLLIKQETISLSFAVVAVIFWLGSYQYLFDVFYGNKYQLALDLAPYASFAILARAINLPLLSATSKINLKWTRAKIVSLAFAINLGLILILVPELGAIGALISWVTAELVITFLTTFILYTKGIVKCL